MTKHTRGGKRPGAGRKPPPEQTSYHTVTIYASHIRFLKSIDPNLSTAIRKLIQSVNH